MDNSNYGLHKREGYCDPAAYPEIRVLGPNRYYAELLMDDYAGMTSEFTAINQYLYHYFYLKHHYKDVAELLENIWICEMLHMEILADTIRLLGGNPVIRGSHSTCGQFWSGQLIYYGRYLGEQLQANIEAEHRAIANYTMHMNMIHDPYVKAILARIIADEQLHLKLFNEALAKYCTGR